MRRTTAGISKAAIGVKNLSVRNNAAVAAGNIGSPEFVPALFGGLETTDKFHCKFAAWALTRIDDPSIFGQMAARLGSAWPG